MVVEDAAAEALVVEPAGGAWRRHLGSLLFLVPAAAWLLAIVIYPVVATVRYSLFNETATRYVGLHNYQAIFSTNSILLTFRNNVIWVLVFPFFVTFIGLTLAVLSERISWSTAFKTIIFMPVVFSLTASALVWRTIFDFDPHVGIVNAVIETVDDWYHPPGAYPVDTSTGQTVAGLASSGVRLAPHGALLSTATVAAGGTIRLGLSGIAPATLSLLGARSAVVPRATPGAVSGLVWRDFSPAHPTAKGQVFPDEVGLPSMRLALIGANGSTVATTTSGPNGLFTFSHVGSGTFRVQIAASNFTAGYAGTFWLGTRSLTPTGGLSQTAQALLSVPLVDVAMIIAYLWIWAGFAMVVIGAGLAALNREVLEAARIDGATEWQTFRRVTVPMLTPVLIVVFVTMIVNVLKIFDIIINMPPGSSQGDANTLALAMYNFGFTGGIHTGLASALAVILFILVIPPMLWNLKKIKG
ncbi:MAG TPA: sugar ABC transporter permease [Thermomicrobiaceae bacterium]|nr:sugar ABC transporter permease [Thermomicrobiaceae bacterium]